MGMMMSLWTGRGGVGFWLAVICVWLLLGMGCVCQRWKW